MRPVALVLILLCALVLALQNSSFAQNTGRGTTTVKVFFGNEKRNPNSDPCSLVYPATRVVPKTQGVARAALEQLFMGPTEKEKAEGFHSWFTPASKSILKSVNIKNKTAYVNLKADTFSILSGNVSTSCGGSQFMSEMETTLLQFPGIKKSSSPLTASRRSFTSFYKASAHGNWNEGRDATGLISNRTGRAMNKC